MKKELSQFMVIKDFKNKKNELPQESGVYIFVSSKNIPRLVGSSTILKIGETLNLKLRMKRYFNLSLSRLSKSPKRRTAFILRNYLDNCSNSKVTLLFKPIKENSLLKEEKRLLKKYFDEHYEVPPLNMGLK
jgi:hypothetical protein